MTVIVIHDCLFIPSWGHPSLTASSIVRSVYRGAYRSLLLWGNQVSLPSYTLPCCLSVCHYPRHSPRTRNNRTPEWWSQKYFAVFLLIDRHHVGPYDSQLHLIWLFLSSHIPCTFWWIYHICIWRARLTFILFSGIVLEKIAEYCQYWYKYKESVNVPDMDVPVELCLELLQAADFLGLDRKASFLPLT